MSDKNNGGPAFPCPESAEKWGMTLRDYFAAGFAQQIFAATTTTITHPENGRHSFHNPFAHTAQQAYELADAMLAERAK